jgi:GAF domain-containing protein
MNVILDATPREDTPSRDDDRLPGRGWLARAIARQPDLHTTLEAVVSQAGVADLGDAVGVLMVQGRRITVGAASDPDVRRADELQLECGQGPGVESILTGRGFISDDLRLDGRWRFWGPQAADAGWLSALSVPLSDGHTFGSLNVYSRQVQSFSRDDRAVAEAFAQHATAALVSIRQHPGRSGPAPRGVVPGFGGRTGGTSQSWSS